ncbi:MAG: dihydrofolate reductase [Candidatus Synoicihabitans palmerolidicus]|nr:dihydrofolate reductase [Candidatus Synoicihabitans palmerolidicus]
MRLVLIAAQSLDGFITHHNEPGSTWASPADQKWFLSILKSFDCNVMGRTTYETVRDAIHLHLSDGRKRIVMTRQPDSFASESVPHALEFTSASASEITARLKIQKFAQCAILGGVHVHDAFLQANLIDEIWVNIEPRIFGSGTPLVRQSHDLSLKLLTQTRLDASDSIVLHYSIVR